MTHMLGTVQQGVAGALFAGGVAKARCFALPSSSVRCVWEGAPPPAHILSIYSPVTKLSFSHPLFDIGADRMDLLDVRQCADVDAAIALFLAPSTSAASCRLPASSASSCARSSSSSLYDYLLGLAPDGEESGVHSSMVVDSAIASILGGQSPSSSGMPASFSNGRPSSSFAASLGGQPSSSARLASLNDAPASSMVVDSAIASMLGGQPSSSSEVRASLSDGRPSSSFAASLGGQPSSSAQIASLNDAPASSMVVDSANPAIFGGQSSSSSGTPASLSDGRPSLSFAASLGGHPSSSGMPASLNDTPASSKIIPGYARRIIRPRKQAFTPPRRTSEQKVHYRKWLGDKDVMMTTGDVNDCGCALHEFGCYSFLIATLMAQQKIDKLLETRLTRFKIKFRKLAPATLAELQLKAEPDGNLFVDYTVLSISVCCEVKAWAEGYPLSTLRHYIKAVAAGRVVTVPQQKTLMGVRERRVHAHNVAAHARSFAREDLLTLSEEQPNTRPYENVAGEVELTKHIDPLIALCRRCKRAVTVKKSAAVPGGPCDPSALCTTICRYSKYAASSLLLGEAFAKPSCFVVQYDAVMKELCIAVRKNKGVSSECDVCRINGHVISLPDKQRTDDEYDLAQYALSKHYSVVDRFRSEERAAQMQSRRDFRIKNRNGLSHSMKDKAASRRVELNFNSIGPLLTTRTCP